MKRLLVLTLYLSTGLSHACGVTEAYVQNVYQYDDGTTMFIVFDRDTDCGCPIANRMAFDRTTGSFFIAGALTAIAANKKVSAFAEAGCPVHGNTARMNNFGVAR
jgi:hypothetical protein